MDRDYKEQPTPDRDIVQPLITLVDLDKFWIGVGAAIEWIAMRGKSMTLEQYYKREDEAALALVTTLADMPAEQAEANVRGVDESKPGPLIPIPSGIWPQTATSDSNDSGQLYRLIGTDDHNEWDAAILSIQLSGYCKIQVRSDFIKDNWPEDGEKTTAPSAERVVSQAQLRRLMEKILRETPIELAPLTQREIIGLVKRCIPGAPRDSIRRIYQELVPNQKPGPRGPRKPDRQNKINELSEEFIAAQLHN
ncbi:hypothetical protein KUG47_16265 [Falsochrobactrum sp. TDYN1]|uniref:Uncharacterized protein n=1 Tax=Falsochrobactrum tianjinense TaxID=2706015 RepID=A0A949UW95_9HYPH|nr:hypothetical protein [Falsochrobactrum sp. TDYN1]MBV2145051.1 hypothetical protein [Falsochrobactrum sp. TDYN1]